MLFELRYYGYDGGCHWLFSHDNKTEEEFQQDCNELLIKYGDEYIASEEGHWVGSADWIEYIVCKLPERGYEHVKPLHATYPELLILGSEDSKEWEPIVGKRLMDKAIKHNFAASFYKDDDIYFVNGLYHTRGCPVLVEMWGEHRGWSFKWDYLDKVTDSIPCDVCKPQKP